MTCAICLEPLKFPISRCENNHEYHRVCILSWNQKNLACPVCRSTYYPVDKEDCATLRSYKNPTVEEIKQVLSVNPLQIRHLQREMVSELDYEKLWLQVISNMPTVIQYRRDAPARLRNFAISLCPKAVLYLENPSFWEILLALELDSSIWPNVASKNFNFTPQQLKIIMVIVLRSNPTNIKFFDSQEAYDFAFELDKNSLYFFTKITFTTCMTIIKNHKSLIPYCMLKITRSVWLKVLKVKPTMIQHYHGADLDIVLEVLRINLKAFFYLNYQHRVASRVINYVLFKSRGKYIKHVPQTLKNCKIAYKLNKSTIHLIHHPTKTVCQWMNSLKPK